MRVMEVKNNVTEYRDATPAEIAEAERTAAEMPKPEPDQNEKRMNEIEAALIELAGMLAGGV